MIELKTMRNIIRDRIALSLFIAFSILVGYALLVTMSSKEYIWSFIIIILYISLVKFAGYVLEFI